MSVTSGFFNSLNGDRRYNAEQMSAIFDGVINDGVFASIGTAFRVTPNEGNTINVGIGRAWFNSTWIFNDAILPITADIPEVLLSRIDAVIIEINRTSEVREGSITIKKGTPSSTPQRPELLNTNQISQHAIAYIHRAPGATEIRQSDITNNVGTSSCPYVTGILQVINIDNIVAEWESQWDDKTNEMETAWNNTANEIVTDYDEWFRDVRNTLEDEAPILNCVKYTNYLTSEDLEDIFNGVYVEVPPYESEEGEGGEVQPTTVSPIPNSTINEITTE